MDGIVEMAKLLKQRDNKHYLGPQIGKVVSPPPGLTVSLGDTILLDKDHLIITAHALPGYTRTVELTGANQVSSTGQVTLVQPLPPETPTVSESWGIAAMNTAGTEALTGAMTFTDTLQTGDEVILMPSTDNQTYYLIDKVVRL